MFKNAINGFTTAWKGLTITIGHLFASNARRKITPISDDNYFKNLEGTNTIQYPKQQLPV
ncbi:MAG: 4Fe-4S dicluster protein, partial [Mucilaginibacter sp.]|nr:4Fe-4S dicluster protein [Mucilaginibacter sp.]